MPLVPLLPPLLRPLRLLRQRLLPLRLLRQLGPKLRSPPPFRRLLQRAPHHRRLPQLLRHPPLLLQRAKVRAFTVRHWSAAWPRNTASIWPVFLAPALAVASASRTSKR